MLRSLDQALEASLLLGLRKDNKFLSKAPLRSKKRPFSHR